MLRPPTAPGEFFGSPSISPEPRDPFTWCGSIVLIEAIGPSGLGPSGKLALPAPGPMGFMMVYIFSLELVESPGLGMMGVPGAPPPPAGPE